MPRDITASWSIRRRGDGWEGTIRVMMGKMPVSLGAEGETPRQAIARAAIAMKAIASSPIASAVLPPGTEAAILAISALAKSRDVRATLRRFSGPGARRLARRLFG